jgi:hypothetical protein
MIMKSTSRHFLGLICIQIFVFAPAFAQRRPAAASGTRGTRPAASSPEKRAESSYAVSEFDVHAGSLPAQYKGHDIVKLSQNFAAREQTKAKGEFETTEQWQERLKAEQSAPVLGGLRLSSIYAFAAGGIKYAI